MDTQIFIKIILIQNLILFLYFERYQVVCLDINFLE